MPKASPGRQKAAKKPATKKKAVKRKSPAKKNAGTTKAAAKNAPAKKATKKRTAKNSRLKKAKPDAEHSTPTATDAITIRGARVNNLQGIDVDLPRDAITVITGVSGSGKSSLAFDTLHAEGQRQYIDSLSAYARQFLDQIPRPDVDSIDGLAPTLAIDQKSGSISSRSTVATVTEIYDYLRLLYARVGQPHCVNCGSQIAQQSAEAIVDSLGRLPAGAKVILMSPMVRGRRGAHREVFESIQASGLVRVRVDGEMYMLEDVPDLAVRKNHTIEAVVDRLVIRDEIDSRLRDSVTLALRLGEGLMTVSVISAGGSVDETLYSTAHACMECGSSFAEIEPRTFSFNSPYGACPTCDGIGRVSSDSQGKAKRGRKKQTEAAETTCPDCNGGRLRAEALAVTVAGTQIHHLVSNPIDQTRPWIDTLLENLDDVGSVVATPICRELRKRLGFLESVGVGYLTLDRAAATLSGGELQRVRLASSIGSGLVGVCYVLDEPSIGLHPSDHDRLIESIVRLKQQGNTVVIVEHDESTMRHADLLIDIGPGAGASGGKVVSCGPPEAIAGGGTLTGDYLAGIRSAAIPQHRPIDHKMTSWLEITGAATHNLKNVDARIPLGTLVGVSGVSGSGKSSLINDTLCPAIAFELDLVSQPPGPFKKLKGFEAIDKLIRIDQSPIGRNARSCPATYSGILDHVRTVFATTRQAKTRGFTTSRFSFNSAAGRCDLCKGHGVEKIEMNFLSDLHVRCTRCGGARFNRQTLQVKFKGASVADVLAMTINEASEFFANVPKIENLLQSLQTVGLGYLHLGQSSTTLSGGEAQRLKLGTELARTSTGRTMYVLDEPTTGLHFDDVRRLITVLQRLVDSGNSVIVIEHNLDLLASCDWILDLGPTGGEGGGQLLAAGTPADIAKFKDNATGQFLANMLKQKG